jgi:hypothetical protein
MKMSFTPSDEEVWGHFIDLDQPYSKGQNYIYSKNRPIVDDYEDTDDTTGMKLWICLPFTKKREIPIQKSFFVHCSLSIILFYLFFHFHFYL